MGGGGRVGFKYKHVHLRSVLQVHATTVTKAMIKEFLFPPPVKIYVTEKCSIYNVSEISAKALSL